MTCYRMYLRTRRQILERRDFEAENDGLAASAAAMVFAACSDRCDGWDLWDGTRHVANRQTAELGRVSAMIEKTWAETEATTQETAVLILESIVAGNGQLALSPQLRAILEHLRSNRELSLGKGGTASTR